MRLPLLLLAGGGLLALPLLVTRWHRRSRTQVHRVTARNSTAR